MSRHSPIHLSSSSPRPHSTSQTRRRPPQNNPLSPNNVGRASTTATRARRSSAQLARSFGPGRRVSQQVYEVASSSPAREERSPDESYRSPLSSNVPTPHHPLVHPPGNYDCIVKRIQLAFIPLPHPPSPAAPNPTPRDATLVELYAYNAARGVVLTERLGWDEWHDFTQWVEKHPQGPEADFHWRRKARLLQESQNLDAERHKLWLNSQTLNDEAEILCTKIDELQAEKGSGHISDLQLAFLQQKIHALQADLNDANELWDDNNREKAEVEAKSWALTDVRWGRLPQWCRSER